MSSKDDHREPAKPASTVPTSAAPSQSSLKSDPTAPTVFDSTEPTIVLPRPEGLVGMTLDERYLVEKELGHGGIGAVYLARDQRIVNRPVVVKVLLEKSLQNDWAVRKFRHEQEALARVDHPGIVGILDTGELPDGKPYIVMQYVEGVTLRSVMIPEGANLERTARFMEQIGHALSAAHEEGIIHRDLKPDNIMIQQLAGGREQIKIIDFGIAKVRDSQVAPSTMVAGTVGTIKYMSPEQLRAENVTNASDIYSLGVITYELVTGRSPFNPETSFQLLETQRDGVRVQPKDLRPALPEAAQAVILKALAFHPQERYQSAAEFGEEFARAINTGAVEPMPPPLPPPEPHPEQRRLIHPGLIAAAALLLMSVIGTIAWWGWKSNTNRSPEQPSGPASPLQSQERTLNYWLTVQKMRDSKPYQEPFDSSGQEIFENGWRFRFNAASPQAGYLYLLNEGPDELGAISYHVLYPTPSVNSGSAQLGVNQPMQTGWYVFDENQGTEKFWIVWSAQAVAEFEAVKGVVNPQDKGAIRDQAQAGAVREFLTKKGSSKPEVEKDRGKKQTNVKGKGEVIVNLVELEHH